MNTLCPVCKTENTQNAKFCLECGIRLELQCPYCHAPSAVGAKFCSACGSNLDFRCTQCGSVSRPGSKFCQQCGVRLVILCFTCQTPTPPAARFCQECGERLERRCAGCGAPILYGAKFCNGCGITLVVPGTETAQRPAATIAPPTAPAPTLVKPAPLPATAPPPAEAPPAPAPAATPTAEALAPPPVHVPSAPEPPTTPLAPDELNVEPEPLLPPSVRAEPPPAARPLPGRRETAVGVAAPAKPSVVQKDERRLVTVLFGDVSGFTAMSESLDPEDVKFIMDQCLKTLADQVTKFEGTVDKFEGDLIMAVWGAPVAHEDDAERAVLAGLGMQEALRVFAEDLQRRRGFSLKMRIGLNTGDVISGAVASGRTKDYTVMGDVVNTASRFEGAAEPGTVLVGAKTYALTKHMIEYQELEPIKVKGKSEPLAVYRPLGARADRGHRRGIEGLQSALVGRGHVLESLVESFQEVVGTRTPQLVTVAGVPGIGKSRLVDEFQQYISSSDYTVGWCKGRCLPYGQGITFYPLAEMLKNMFSIADSDPKQVVLDRLLAGVRDVFERAAGGEVATTTLDEEARQVCHRLGYAMGVSYPDSDLSEITPANMKDELLWAWRRFFYYWASAAPGIIVIEDLHWADHVVLDLLQSLLDVLEDVPILIIACARPELINQALDLVEGLNRRTIDLEPLTHEESVQLVDNLLSPNLLSRSWKDQAASAAGGVPFFLEEFVRGLVEEGQVVRGSVGWVPAQAEHLPDLPDTVFATLFARMDRLPSLEKAVLQRAAIVGSRFWDSALCYPAPQLGREAGALLGLQAKNWVAQQNSSSFVQDREYVFTNDLVRESAYKVLTRKVRSTEHERVAQWLEQKVSGREEEFVELLAYHYGQATLQESADDEIDVKAMVKAADYGWRAGERSYLLQSYLGALTRYDDTLAVLARLSEFYPAGDLQVAGKALQDLQTAVLLRRALVKESLGRYDSAIEDLNLTQTWANVRQAPIAEATSNMQKARVLRLKGQSGDAVICAERAIDLYRSTNDSSGKAQALLVLGELYSDQAKFAEFERLSREAHEIAQVDSPRWLRARSLTLLGSACIYQGKMAEALEYLAGAVDIYEDMKDRRGLATGLLMLGRVLHANGQSADSIENIERAYTVFDELGDSPMRVAALATLAQLNLERGNLLAARLYADRGAVLSKGLGQIGQQMRCLLLLGQVCIAEADVDMAVARLLEAKAICEESDQGAILPEVYRLLAQAYLEAGQPDVAEQYALLGRQVVEESDHYSQGTTWMALGEVLAGLDRAEEAEEAFQHALKELEASGEPYEIGEVHLAYASFLLSNQRQEQARDQLLRAQECFSSLETRDKLERLAQLQRQLEPVT